MDLPTDGLDFVSQRALNILAREVARNVSTAVVLAGSHILGKEIQRRLKGCEVIWMPPGRSRPASDKAYPTRKLRKWTDARSGLSREGGGLILACPLGEGNQDGCGQILVELPCNHSLHVLAYGWLSRLRPEWQFLRTSLSSLGRARAGMRRAGWVVNEEYGIQGPRSAAWGYAAKWWAHLRREDLADRCYHAMREGSANRGGRADLAVLVVMSAKRTLGDGQSPSTNRITSTRV